MNLDRIEPGNGWSRWENHVLAELRRLNDWLAGVDRKLDRVGEDISGLKVKSGIWGLIGGLIPAISALLYILLKAS